MTTDQELLFDDNLPPDHRSGFVALVGKPNVGKSTLLNRWLGVKLAAVSPKPQTTRNRILGILTQEKAQVIFMDTPGIHLPHSKLGEYMVRTASDTLRDADVVVFMVDGQSPPNEADRQVAQAVAGARCPSILAINKVDAVASGALLTNWAAYAELGEFDTVMGISALEGTMTDELFAELLGKLPFGPRFFPEDQISNVQERFIASELIREQLLRNLEQEVPYASAVIVDEFTEAENHIEILATVFVERESQKRIVIGNKGSMIKHISEAAAKDISNFFSKRTKVRLWVKVRDNWRKDNRSLQEFGYSFEDK